MVGILRCAVAAGGAGFRALMLGIIRFRPRTIRIGVICIIISACAAAGTGLCTAMLGVRILAPRTGGIVVIAVVRCGISAGAARCCAAVLTAAVIVPASVAHAMTGVFVIRVAAVAAIGFAPVLTAGIFLPASIRIAVTGCVDGFALALAAIAAIFPVAVSRASGIIFIVQNPCMASAVRASPRTIRAGTMIFIHISAEIFCVMTFIALVVLGMAARGVRCGNVGALQRILFAAWAGADNAGRSGQRNAGAFWMPDTDAVLTAVFAVSALGYTPYKS
jgi:hypothetical protein